MKLQILDTGKKTARENMQIDEQLLQELTLDSSPILHFYDWVNPSATFGYFSHPSKLLSSEAVEKYTLDLAKRPTGGGIIFHQFDFAFSFLLPASHPRFSLNTLENYGFVNRIIATILKQYLKKNDSLGLLHCLKRLEKEGEEKLFKNFCMAIPTVYDVVSDGRKLAGGAQRRTRVGFLHQASIALVLPPESFLKDVLSPSPPITAAMQQSSYPLLGETCSKKTFAAIQTALKRDLSDQFTKACSINQ